MNMLSIEIKCINIYISRYNNICMYIIFSVAIFNASSMHNYSTANPWSRVDFATAKKKAEYYILTIPYFKYIIY